MPRFNDSAAITQGIERHWFDQTRTILQDCSSGVCKIRLSDGTPVDDRGDVAHVYGNGRGVWAAFRAGTQPRVFGLGWELPGAGMNMRLDDPVGPDGSVAYKIQFQSFGPWKIRHADGSDGPTFGGDCATVQNIGGDRMIWTENKVVKSNFGFAGEGVKADSIRYRDGHFLFQSNVTGELVLDGHVIGPAGNYFRPDVRELNGVIHVAWALDEGETNPRARTLTPAELAVLPKLTGETTPPLPPPPPPPMQSPVPNLLNELKALRAEYPAEVTPNQAVECLNRFAEKHEGFGLHKKTGGNHAPQPGTDIPCSVDWLLYKHSSGIWGTDVFGDGPDNTKPPTDKLFTNVATPSWRDWHIVSDPQNFVEPSDVNPEPVPDSGNTNPAGSLDGIVTGLIAAAVGPLHAEIAALRVELAAIPRNQGGSFPQRIALRTENGHYLCAEQGGGGEVNATRTEANGWETFTVEPK